MLKLKKIIFKNFIMYLDDNKNKRRDNMKIPKKISFANLPTKIEKLEKLSSILEGPQIYIKRDDQTGTEVSGNKIRKIEFAVQEALDKGCDMLITCGSIQSNHARATAVVAAKLGMSCYLILKGSEKDELEGNYFLDRVLGSRIHFITFEDYSNNLDEIMEEIKQKMIKEGHKPYIMPTGASNGIGTFGYYAAMDEIIKQEKEMNIKFDAVVTTVGSGGTYAGLFLRNEILKSNREIYGINICNDAEYFKNEINDILYESFQYLENNIDFSKEEINIIDGYVGDGYALSRSEELEFIHEMAMLEGIILDPVYTGKAMYGLVDQIKKGKFKKTKNILFIHTGGLFGLFPKRNEFSF